MLYEEFLLGTGAKATKSNYEVYKAIEGVYNLHPTMTKEEAYELAKPMIDNELTPEEEALLGHIDDELAGLASILWDYKKRRLDHWEQAEQAENEDAKRLALDEYHRADNSVSRVRGKMQALKALAAYIRTGR